jgi:hypothetical protein
MIFDKKPKYCEHCGQALDWSEEKWQQRKCLKR